VTAVPKPVREVRAPRPLKRSRANVGKKTTKHRRKKLNLKKVCVALWAQWIKRNGRCEFLGRRVGNELHLQCANGLQAMHGFGKKAHPGVRFAIWNGWAGCGRVHIFFTWQPHQWDSFMRSQWGNEMYESRLAEAMQVRKYDLEQVARSLRAALEVKP
jgi:hypothetical protein